MAFLDALLVDRGYQVIQARNGVEAMVSLTSGDSEFPHAVLLDIGLPLEGGVSVLSFLRNVLRSGLPVIVVTGRQDAEEEATLRRLGISAFLRKPPSADQVLSALTRALA
jgi:DNA-binding response OmpR family regulator